MPSLVQCLVSAQGAGSTLSNSSSATSILPAQAKYTLPANFLDYPGRWLKITATGQISNIVTTPGTLTLDLRLGATIVFNGGAMQLSTTAHTTKPWWWEVLLTLRTTGSAANFMGQSVFVSQAANISTSDSTSGHSLLVAPNTTPAVGNNFDATSSLALDLFATFSVADTANAIALQQYQVTTEY